MSILQKKEEVITIGDEDLKSYKDLQIHMEHPFFSLGKKPNHNITKYEHGENWIKIIPSHKGRATIYDKDILVFIISQIRQKIYNNEEVSRHVAININDYFKTAHKSSGGKAYDLFVDSLDRLVGTQIKTNIKNIEKVDTSSYGMIDSYDVVRKDDKENGRILSCVVTVSNKIFDPIIHTKPEILTINPKIFDLRKPTEKRLYDIARKHIGYKESWKIGIKLLSDRIGTNIENKGQRKAELRRTIKALIKNHQEKNNFTFPDFVVSFDIEKDQVTFYQKNKWWQKKGIEDGITFTFPIFKTVDYEEAKKVAPKEICIYTLEQEWQEWVLKNKDKFKLNEVESLLKSYLGFCKGRNKNNGQNELFG